MFRWGSSCGRATRPLALLEDWSSLGGRMKNTSPQGGQFEGLAGGSLEEGETGVCSSAVLIL